jgi:hypothetical protein
MVHVNSPRTPLTVNLPVDLIEQLEIVAREKQVPVEEIVMEACLAFTEPYLWERCYAEWRRQHPDAVVAEFDSEGNDIGRAGTQGQQP